MRIARSLARWSARQGGLDGADTSCFATRHVGPISRVGQFRVRAELLTAICANELWCLCEAASVPGPARRAVRADGRRVGGAAAPALGDARRRTISRRPRLPADPRLSRKPSRRRWGARRVRSEPTTGATALRTTAVRSIPAIRNFYDRWRPWWGGVLRLGAILRPLPATLPIAALRPRAISSDLVCGRRARTTTAIQKLRAASLGIPRTFVYDWAPEQGDTSPRAE